MFNGMRRKSGWQMSGLPWTYDLDPGKMALPEREETGKIHPRQTPRTDPPRRVWAMPYGTTSPGTQGSRVGCAGEAPLSPLDG